MLKGDAQPLRTHPPPRASRKKAMAKMAGLLPSLILWPHNTGDFRKIGDPCPTAVPFFSLLHTQTAQA